MSRQTFVTNYFVAGKLQNTHAASTKCYSVKDLNTKSELNMTSPLISPKREILDTICISSDDDDFCTPKIKIKRGNSGGSCSNTTNSSQDTLIYTPTTPQKAQTPKSKSSSDKKYFSPNKNRLVLKRTPVKVNLAKKFGNDSKQVDDEQFENACSGLDLKTIFLLTTIHKYLKDELLRKLLDLSSQELLMKYTVVVKPGMRLVSRLYWYKRSWHKLDKVKQISSVENAELDDPSMNLMLESLVTNGWIMPNITQGEDVISFDEYTALLKSEELKQICKSLKLKPQSKQDAVDVLKVFCRQSYNITKYFNGATTNNYQRVLRMMREKSGRCYKMSESAYKTLYRLYILMFLGVDYDKIREKKLELMYVYDKVNKETYPVDKNMEIDNASAVFKSREEFEKYIEAHTIYEDYILRTDNNQKCEIVKQVYDLYNAITTKDRIRYVMLPVWLRRYTPAYICIKILEAGVQDLKRQKINESYELALNILNLLIDQDAFRQHKKAEWYSEKALVLVTHLKRDDEGAEALIEGFRSDLSQEAKDHMRPRALKMVKQNTIHIGDDLKTELLNYATDETILEGSYMSEHIYKKPMDKSSGGKMKFSTKTAHGLVVQDAEEFCITHYISKKVYTNGAHWEGRIITNIFFLLFWDIIYSKSPAKGVYLSHYQMYPLDMFYDSFYTNRKSEIDKRLNTIENTNENELSDIMTETWNNRPEGELSGINRSIELSTACDIATCLGGQRVAAICRRLAINYGYACSGFPDLTLWNVDTKRIKFVEVKTDSDKPSVKQVQWMRYLHQNNIETEFCYVGVNTTRVKARSKKS